jgi:3-deoxy-D-manno-octulosonic-acid transferase
MVIPHTRVVLAQAFGMLADLYLAAATAYVGGGFARGGLHAVAEPAAVGLPAIVGDHWEGAVDIAPMIAAGGALALSRQSGAELAALVTRLSADRDECYRRGCAARATLNEGAAQRTAEALLQMLVH